MTGREFVRWTRSFAALAMVALVVAACHDGQDSGRPDASAIPVDQQDTSGEATTSTLQLPPAHTSEIYADLQHWLCHPDRTDDACDIDLDITRVESDGTHRVEPVRADPDAPVDCFYVYPTVSDDPSPNSDLVPSETEYRVAKAQAAPWSSVCRVYAPLYRQVTLAALTQDADGIADRALAYGDVVDAWSHYLAHHNRGRGVVLIGHSQGAGHLRELLTRRIDTNPDELSLLVSAVLLGTTVRVPIGADTGAHFQNLAPCTDRDDLSCVISYSTYSQDEPPGETGLFGGIRLDPNQRAMCTNPAVLGGGPARLQSILTTRADRDPGVETPYVLYDGLAEGECVVAGDYHYLEVRYGPGSAAWPADLGGRISPQWGLHLIDMGIALGDLRDLVAHQGTNFVSRSEGSP